MRNRVGGTVASSERQSVKGPTFVDPALGTEITAIKRLALSGSTIVLGHP